ncbi:ABC transporter ATP-binding protein [Pinisolibacter aquiterrae]|uniref:ABC transporter ATP-binding protein n=1 Tax=Pinisolibacter aquiterrae TaxID=2815579 RepID=UPI001EE5E151|nr:ABC transporter ATP-binding protein [Pinisolibacter aquiterrae]
MTGGTVALVRRLVADQGLRHWKGYVVAFVCMAAIAGSTSLAAWLMRDVIDKVFLEKSQSAIFALSGAVAVIYVVKGLATFGQQVTLSRIANAIVASVQARIFDHLLRLNLSYFADRHTSEFVARQSYIAASCGAVLNIIITSLGRDLLTLIGLLTVMLVQDPTMSLIAFLVMPGAVFGVQKLVKRAKAIMKAGFTQGMMVVEITQETVQGMKVVKAFGLEDHQRARMAATIDLVRHAADKFASVGARTAPLMETLGGFAVAGVILYGGWRVTSAGATPGVFMSFITALLLAYDPAKRLARVHVELAGNLVGVQMMYDFLAEPAPEVEDAALPPLAVGTGRVVFDDVRFAYRDDEPVLDGLDLVAEAGKTTALVGRSGGGKSTILSLLLRFWEPDGGRITIDGTEIHTVSRRSLRAAIGYVGQDVFLFKGSIAENIAMGREDATRAEIEAAAKAAYAHDFVMGFPAGYDTQVGENGAQLSGGQRQRLAIARAILKDAPILLLDEATAALDTESERAIQQALEALSRGRTTLVIAHRLQTIEKADAICVIEEGKVLERGTHAELLAHGGRYAGLHAVQFG